MADAYSLLADHGFLDPSEAAPKARAAAETALNIDPDCAEANVSLAFIRTVFDWAWADAEPSHPRFAELVTRAAALDLEARKVFVANGGNHLLGTQVAHDA